MKAVLLSNFGMGLTTDSLAMLCGRILVLRSAVNGCAESGGWKQTSKKFLSWHSKSGFASSSSPLSCV
jgi:hypothetical protein